MGASLRAAVGLGTRRLWSVVEWRCLSVSALPARAGHQDARPAQPLLHAAPVPAVPRPQRLQASGESRPVGPPWGSSGLRLCVPNAGGPGSIPGGVTRPCLPQVRVGML